MTTSSEGVDVVGRLFAISELLKIEGKLPAASSLLLDVRDLVAELIEAADAYLHSDKEPLTAHMVLGGELAEIEVGSAEENRLKAALVACRATQGAHP